MTKTKTGNLLGKVKKKEGENLTPANIKKVIDLLEASPSITKKEACERLSIAYNTTRLAKIIDEYKDEIAETARKRKANIGKPISNFEIQTVVEGYLDRQSIKDIAARIYRPTDVVKKIIAAVGVPNTSTEYNYVNIGMVPDQCMSNSFYVGQIVWSMAYNSPALVTEEYVNYKGGAIQGSNYYSLYIIQSYEHQSKWFAPRDHGGFNAGAWSYDIASLEHLAKYGIDIYRPYKSLVNITSNPPKLGSETVDISNMHISEPKKRPVRSTKLVGNSITVITNKKEKRMPDFLRTNIIETELCI